jgi:flagellar protein FliO/FliZ
VTQALAPALTALAALAAVLVLVWLAARGAQWAGIARSRPSGRLIAVEDQIALDSRRRLLLIRCADRQVLLLTGGTSDIVVGWMGRDG